MRRPLIPHPSSAAQAVTNLAVEVERPTPDCLVFTYRLGGDPAGLALPPPAAPERTDDLWRHTCFEAFLRREGAPGYVELNFAPSGQWAAYGFAGYREAMRVADEIGAPAIQTRSEAGAFQLRAALRVPALAELAPWRLAISAVVEQADGSKSYWALRHPPGRPDFHHPDGFVLELAGAQQA